MDCLLQGKVALVTGRGRGLGLAEAEALAAQIHAGGGRPGVSSYSAAKAAVGALLAFLCSVPAGYVTGALICIDGGRREYTWQ